MNRCYTVANYNILNFVRHSQDKERADKRVECPSCRNETEHKSMSENSNKTDNAGVGF